MAVSTVKEKTLQSKRVFDGRLIQVDLLEVELESGARATRDIVRHPGAVAALCRMPDGRFVLVRQFRKPIERCLLEVVAGCLNPGEDPAVCAAREIREETGYAVRSLTRLGVVYTSPGYTNERTHQFFAELESAPAAQSPDPDENLEVVHMEQDEIAGMVARGEMADAKTVLLWLACRNAGLI